MFGIQRTTRDMTDAASAKRGKKNIKGAHSGTVEPCVLWCPKGLQAHGFESCLRSECRLGFLTRSNGFLAGSPVYIKAAHARTFTPSAYVTTHPKGTHRFSRPAC
ncbi:hypothetical protein E2C01_019268 [Portunus trituberculatus]|uniref:Uncharacterized protein n=1 Tax=Portunus trituberculatus TaxID=210409 RepID=A0A5B7DYQ6_PORTR|nr:hypothetical protein [Portunus trituberculatus]